MVVATWFDQDETVINLKVKRWDNAEFREALLHISALCASKHYAVDIIIDLQHADRIPSRMLLVWYDYLRSTPDNLRHIIVKSSNTFWRRLWHTTAPIHGVFDAPLTFVQTEGDAVRYLETH